MSILDKAISNILFLGGNTPLTIENSESRSTIPSTTSLIRDSTQEYLDPLKKIIDQDVKIIASSEIEQLCDETQKIRELFFNILPNYAYNRAEIVRECPLERILDRDVYSSHSAEDIIDPVSEKRIHETLLEADFSLRLGIQPDELKGRFKKTYYILDRDTQPLGIFKPQVKKWWRFADRYGAAEEREAHLAEIGASRIDQLLGTRLVPYTTTLTLKNPEPSTEPTGSFQFFVHSAPPLYDYLQGDNLWADPKVMTHSLNTPANHALQLRNFEDLTFLDMLTGNNDGHFKNILCKPTQDGGLQLVAIDNGNAFPWCTDQDLPFYKRTPLHTYKWRALPHAQRPYSSEALHRIKTIDLQSVIAAMRQVLVDTKTPSSLGHMEDKIYTLQDRYETILQEAQEGVPIADIAQSIIDGKPDDDQDDFFFFI
ncbi:MAG: hypothetical protein KGZ39_04870 [Simkania sp.]|nr:hypothetical protein [Simkania sp.]